KRRSRKRADSAGFGAEPLAMSGYLGCSSWKQSSTRATGKPTPKQRLSDIEDHFAELRARFEIFVGPPAFGERKRSIDYGLQFAGGEKLENRSEFGFVAHVGPENGKLSAEEKAQIDFGIEAGGSSAGDKAPASGEAGDAVVPGGGADVFEDDIHSSSGGEATDFVFDLLRLVVDEVVGASF